MTGAARPSPSGFRFVGEREVHRGHVITVVEAELLTPEGHTITRDVVRSGGAVSVVPLDGDEVVLVRQYRPAVHDDLLEIPAGRCDVPGEPPEATAVRELEEEVGLTTDRLELLARFYNAAGFSDHLSHVYLATDLRPVPHRREGPEERHMTVERVALDEAAAWVADGRIVDAKTVIGVLAALRHLGR